MFFQMCLGMNFYVGISLIIFIMYDNGVVSFQIEEYKNYKIIKYKINIYIYR